MKILNVTTGFYPATSWGGPVAVIYQNAVKLIEREHEVSVCTTNRFDKCNVIEPRTFTRDVQGIHVNYLRTFMFCKWPGIAGPFVVSLGGLKKLQRQIKIHDVVHIHALRTPLAILAIMLARFYSKPIILQPHGSVPLNGNSILIKKIFDRVLLRASFASIDTFIALTNQEKEDLYKKGANVSKVEIVPNGMERSLETNSVSDWRLRKAFNILAEDGVILSLGRLHKIKGIDFLIKAFAKLPRYLQENNWLVIAGPDGGQERALRELSETLGIENRVIFTGSLNRQQVYAAYQDATIYVLPSRYDAFPMTIVEACNYGVPIIVSDKCGIAAEIDNIAGLGVPSGDPEALSNRIEMLLDDLELSETLGQGGRQLAQNMFSSQAIVDSLEQIYEHVTA